MYDLGHGIETTNPREAGEFLMKREFPEIFHGKETDQKYLFIPDIYLYEELTEKVREKFNQSYVT